MKMPKRILHYFVYVRFVLRLIGRVLRREGFWWVAAIVAVLVIGSLLSWRFWDDLADDKESLSTTVRNIGLLIGGVVAILLAVWRSIVAERQADTAQQGLLNERYQRGAEMIGSDVLSVRLGGIYALQRLAAEHPEQYHIPIMKLFCTFARNPTGRDLEEQETQLAKAGLVRVAPPLREDVQVILTTIGDRSKVGLEIEKKTEKFQLELHRASLSRANLPGANLAHANLGGADLQDAYLLDAKLSRVYLQGARLNRANLINANLSGAQIGSADLSGVIAQGADLSGASCVGANLSHADLQRANLSSVNIGTSDLSDAKLRDANLSGVVFGIGSRITDSDILNSEKVFAHLTQRQLDEAYAEPDNPPTIAVGTVDIESGKPLVWHGKPCRS